MYEIAVVLSIRNLTWASRSPLAKVWIAKAPPINSKRCIWFSLSRSVHRPPVDTSPRAAPHPRRDASVSITRLGWSRDSFLPFHLLSSSAHHVSSVFISWLRFTTVSNDCVLLKALFLALWRLRNRSGAGRTACDAADILPISLANSLTDTLSLWRVPRHSATISPVMPLTSCRSAWPIL